MSFSLDKMAIIVLTLVSVSVGVAVLQSFRQNSPDLHPVERSIKNSDYPVCQGFEDNQSVGFGDFRTLLYGRYLGACGKKGNNVTLEFRLSSERLEKIVSGLSDKPEILYREDCKPIPGFKGVIVEGRKSSNPLFGLGEGIKVNGTQPVMICSQ